MNVDVVVQPQTVIGSFFVLFFGGLAFYLLTSGSSFLYYRVFRRQRHFANDDANLAVERAQRALEWRWAVYNVFGNALVTAPIHHLVLTGRSRVYFDVSEHSWAYLLFSALAVLLITEPLVYWAHRLLHHPVLYKKLHIHHHQFRVPSPWTSMAFHPVDSFMQAAPHHLCAFLFPMHAGLYLFFIMFLQVWSTFIHERVTWVRSGLINNTAHHTLHHKANKHNFGQFFSICDRIFGTYKSPVGLVYDGADPAVVAPNGPPAPARQTQPV